MSDILGKMPTSGRCLRTARYDMVRFRQYEVWIRAATWRHSRTPPRQLRLLGACSTHLRALRREIRSQYRLDEMLWPQKISER